MTYSDKLKSSKWQKKRLEILQRDNFTCQLCDDTENMLQVHHIKYADYKSNPWDIDNSCLITYCKHCHCIVEALKRSNSEFTPKKIINIISKNRILVKAFGFYKNEKYFALFYIDDETDISTVFMLKQEQMERNLNILKSIQ